MADTGILNRAEKYIKGKGQTLNKYDLVGFANAETDFLSKHILELQADKDKLIDENKQAKEIIRGFMSWGKGLFPTWQEVVSKAEVFLKE